MDIKIDCESGKFKFRVCGILKHKNKFLAVKIDENNFFCLPGGHVELGEDTKQAILREMKEELGFDVKIDRLVAVNQNFFKTDKNLPFHEIGFYYIVNALSEKDINFNDYSIKELDKGKLINLEFKWFSLDELKQIDFRPNFLVSCLESKETLINITKD